MPPLHSPTASPLRPFTSSDVHLSAKEGVHPHYSTPPSYRHSALSRGNALVNCKRPSAIIVEVLGVLGLTRSGQAPSLRPPLTSLFTFWSSNFHPVIFSQACGFIASLYHCAHYLQLDLVWLAFLK